MLFFIEKMKKNYWHDEDEYWFAYSSPEEENWNQLENFELQIKQNRNNNYRKNV